MKQVVQAISGGPVRVEEVPAPSIGPTEVLVETSVSTLSPGTERAVTALAQASLIDKARARPDLVRQVIKKAQTEGLGRTIETVRSRLEGDLPLGYSAAGVALEVGEAVANIMPGQRVATAGAGKANHAEYQAVPGLLCAPIPDGVSDSDASFATIAAIALHGFRLSDADIGSKVVVIGLGLVGQLALRLALASGCDVVGVDVADFPLEQASALGIDAIKESGHATTSAILEWSRGAGADAILVTAGGKGSDVMRRTPEIARDRATVVVVGDVGVNLTRGPFYEKELAVRFARSYGPGRYERTYEDWAVDYPAGFVRWTEGRNLECFLDLVDRGPLTVSELVTHRFPIAEAVDAYELIEKGSEPSLGVQLEYPRQGRPDRVVEIGPARAGTSPGVGLIGAGAFARTVLLPTMKEAGFKRFVSVSSASGVSAKNLAGQAGFEKAVTLNDDVLTDPDVSVIVIATPHSTHADLVARALRAGKHVFCEKPLSVTMEELEQVEAALAESSGILFVGFNRRWAPAVGALRAHFDQGSGPLVISYRVNAGKLPSSHWYHDRREGGRLIGEVCHFIDTCAAISGTAVVAATAVGAPEGEMLLGEHLAVALRFGDGSVGTIAYAAGGHRSTEKERIEVLGRGRSGIIKDFREITLDGINRKLRREGKGHQEEIRAFLSAVQDPSSEFDRGGQSISSMRATLEAAASLGTRI